MLYNPNCDKRVGNPLEADLYNLIGWRPSLPMGRKVSADEIFKTLASLPRGLRLLVRLSASSTGDCYVSTGPMLVRNR